MLKSNKGVTLVALVITIIVLLILAGVSISLVVGDNGVLNNATTAVDSTNEASAWDAIQLAVSSAQTDYFSDYVDDQSLTFYSYDSTNSEYTYYEQVAYYLSDSDGIDGCEIVAISSSSETGTISVLLSGVVYTCEYNLNASESGLVLGDIAVDSTTSVDDGDYDVQ